jgi:hypothetical protein
MQKRLATTQHLACTSSLLFVLYTLGNANEYLFGLHIAVDGDYAGYTVERN